MTNFSFVFANDPENMGGRKCVSCGSTLGRCYAFNSETPRFLPSKVNCNLSSIKMRQSATTKFLVGK